MDPDFFFIIKISFLTKNLSLFDFCRLQILNKSHNQYIKKFLIHNWDSNLTTYNLALRNLFLDFPYTPKKLGTKQITSYSSFVLWQKKFNKFIQSLNDKRMNRFFIETKKDCSLATYINFSVELPKTIPLWFYFRYELYFNINRSIYYSDIVKHYLFWSALPNHKVVLCSDEQEGYDNGLSHHSVCNRYIKTKMITKYKNKYFIHWFTKVWRNQYCKYCQVEGDMCNVMGCGDLIRNNYDDAVNNEIVNLIKYDGQAEPMFTSFTQELEEWISSCYKF